MTSRNERRTRVKGFKKLQLKFDKALEGLTPEERERLLQESLTDQFEKEKPR